MSTSTGQQATADKPRYVEISVDGQVYKILPMKFKQIREVWPIMSDMGLLANEPSDPNFINAQVIRTDSVIKIFALAAKRSPDTEKLTVEYLTDNMDFQETLDLFQKLNDLLDVSGFIMGKTEPLKAVAIPSAA